MIRLDKFLCEMNIGTRSTVKEYIKKGRINVDGDIVKSSDLKIDPEKQIVSFDGRRIAYAAYEYYMLNKPAGVVSAVTDKKHQTVVDLITDKLRKDLFPVGRLDIDTEGFLIITNDGDLTHRLLSPKKHVKKVYYAKIDGKVMPEHVKAFADGIILEDGTEALPGILKILKSGPESEIELEIYEGKFHQVKRMFEAVDMQVTYLKRISMGKLDLDENLKPGEYRKLTDKEIELLNDNREIC